MAYRHVPYPVTPDRGCPVNTDINSDNDEFYEPEESPCMDNRLTIHSHRWSRKRKKFVAKERIAPYLRYFCHTRLCPYSAIIVDLI